MIEIFTSEIDFRLSKAPKAPKPKPKIIKGAGPAPGVLYC